MTFHTSPWQSETLPKAPVASSNLFNLKSGVLPPERLGLDAVKAFLISSAEIATLLFMTESPCQCPCLKLPYLGTPEARTSPK